MTMYMLITILEVSEWHKEKLLNKAASRRKETKTPDDGQYTNDNEPDTAQTFSQNISKPIITHNGITVKEFIAKNDTTYQGTKEQIRPRPPKLKLIRQKESVTDYWNTM